MHFMLVSLSNYLILPLDISSISNLESLQVNSVDLNSMMMRSKFKHSMAT